MQIPIDTAPLRALDVPTRWLLATALDDAAEHCERLKGEIPADFREPQDELTRKVTTYRQISEAIRD